MGYIPGPPPPPPAAAPPVKHPRCEYCARLIGFVNTCAGCGAGVAPLSLEMRKDLKQQTALSLYDRGLISSYSFLQYYGFYS